MLWWDQSSKGILLDEIRPANQHLWVCNSSSEGSQHACDQVLGLPDLAPGWVVGRTYKQGREFLGDDTRQSWGRDTLHLCEQLWHWPILPVFQDDDGRWGLASVHFSRPFWGGQYAPKLAPKTWDVAWIVCTGHAISRKEDEDKKVRAHRDTEESIWYLGGKAETHN